MAQCKNDQQHANFYRYRIPKTQPRSYQALKARLVLWRYDGAVQKQPDKTWNTPMHDHFRSNEERKREQEINVETNVGKEGNGDSADYLTVQTSQSEERKPADRGQD